jgi:hypothetical protein
MRFITCYSIQRTFHQEYAKHIGLWITLRTILLLVLAVYYAPFDNGPFRS